MASKIKGTVYLLHFNQKYHHASHYLGFSTNLSERLDKHQKGNGARLTQVIVSVGIGFECVRIWQGQTRAFERQLKNRRDAPALCPHCRAERNSRKNEWRKAKRRKAAESGEVK